MEGVGGRQAEGEGEGERERGRERDLLVVNLQFDACALVDAVSESPESINNISEQDFTITQLLADDKRMSQGS